MEQSDLNLIKLSATGTLNNLSDFYMDDDDVEDECVDHVDFNVNYSCTLGEEAGFPMTEQQVTEEKYEDDWCLVECCS
ncbi:hypothetical protein MtrunA17_Chr4g0030371 [Medicago truncatula]|nr:hypothetical protein MtrunA17_Chr4g0030371 [Medicago truncatula]